MWVGAKVVVWWWLYATGKKDDEARKKDEEAQKVAEEESSRKAEEAVKRESEEERSSTERENKEIVNEFVALVSSAGAQAQDMMRAARALEGGGLEVMAPEKLAIAGILQVLHSISEANGGVSSGIARLYHGIRGRLEPAVQLRVTDCIRLIETGYGDSELCVPGMVSLLAAYDQTQGTTLATKAAATYCSLVQTARSHCDNSVAVKLVTNRYDELLKPYTGHASGRHSAHFSSDRDFNSSAAGNCLKCVKYYLVLGLNGKTSGAELKQAYKDLAKVWHPDRFSEKDVRLRRMAGERLTEINEAYGHISKCESSRL
jgi:hypothetical protein